MYIHVWVRLREGWQKRTHIRCLPRSRKLDASKANIKSRPRKVVFSVYQHPTRLSRIYTRMRRADVCSAAPTPQVYNYRSEFSVMKIWEFLTLLRLMFAVHDTRLPPHNSRDFLRITKLDFNWMLVMQYSLYSGSMDASDGIASTLLILKWSEFPLLFDDTSFPNNT